MEQVDCDSWEEFEKTVESLRDKRKELDEERGGYVSDLLFRGQSNHDWSLKSTLERAGGETSFWSYFQLISAARPQVETFTKTRWEMEEWPELNRWSRVYENFGKTLPGYDYLVYLRHHGFPSPLLDWSESPYIAAFFAFFTFPEPQPDRVAVYAYLEFSGKGKAAVYEGEPRIDSLGPCVRSHSRHFLQKSQYTIAGEFKDDGWHFTQHEKVFSNPSEEGGDQLWKITMPSNERVKVLTALDSYNLNEYSLFQTEEALLKTISVRDFVFR